MQCQYTANQKYTFIRLVLSQLFLSFQHQKQKEKLKMVVVQFPFTIPCIKMGVQF